MAKHLAVLHQPFLSAVLDGRKTIESRFTRVKCTPYHQIMSGDVVLIKASGGPVMGEFTAGRVDSFDIASSADFQKLKKYAAELCSDLDPKFWASRQDTKYVTLIKITQLKVYDRPYPFPKKDRRGWVVLR